MVWHLVLVFIISGQPIEMQDRREFPNEQACEAEARRLTQVPFMRWPAAFGCIREDRA